MSERTNEHRRAVEEEFYRECARLLGTVHTYRPWIGPPPNRWNNRHPGNGRFPGFGTIRMHAPNRIHVALRHPVHITRSCASSADVYRLLRRIMRSAGQPHAAAGPTT
jgi:hypothetical protein